MPRRSQWDRAAVLAMAASQHHLITAGQLLALGVPRSTVYRPNDIGGMFTWVLPGLHRLDGVAPLVDDQRDLATLLDAGPSAALTGTAALRRAGVRAARRPALNPENTVHVLIEHRRRRDSKVFVQVERTQIPYVARQRDGFTVVSNARAVVDAARRCTDQEAVRALVFEVVQRRFSTVDALQHEWKRAQIRGSRFVRLALEEVAGGARSIPEGDVRRSFLDAGWSRLLFNPVLESLDGEFIACPDAYDPETGVCLEVDSVEFHFDEVSWQRTMRRHSRMTARGLSVIHVPPSRAAREPAEVLREFAAAVDARAGYPAPAVRVRGAEANAQ